MSGIGTVVLGPTRAVVFPLPIAILILLVPPMRIGVYAMANVGGRYASLDMPHAEPDLSATLLANLKAHVAAGVIEASGNVYRMDSRLELCSGADMNDMGRMQ
jgi:hypothetical protein